MELPFILLALLIGSLPFVLPIISLVRHSRLRARVEALENALHAQKQTIDDLTKLVLPAGVDIEIKT